VPQPLQLTRSATAPPPPWPVVALALLALPSILVAVGPAAGAQGPSDPPHFMGALLQGMVILMVPSFLVCLGITIMAYRRHKRSVQE
jgi:hypothetical protein